MGLLFVIFVFVKIEEHFLKDEFKDFSVVNEETSNKLKTMNFIRKYCFKRKKRRIYNFYFNNLMRQHKSRNSIHHLRRCRFATMMCYRN